jgi:hypothetical protein
MKSLALALFIVIGPFIPQQAQSITIEMMKCARSVQQVQEKHQRAKQTICIKINNTQN